MPKTFTQYMKKSSNMTREATRQFYIDKYFNLWYNQYEWLGLDYQQVDLLMRRLWSVGKVAFSRIKNTEDIAVTDFAPQLFNMYDYPITVNLIPARPVPFINQSKAYVVDEEAVIGYAQRNKKPISVDIMYKINEIVEVEMLIKICQNTYKSPYIVTTSKEDESKIKAVFENIMADEPVLYMSADNLNAIKVLVNNNPYILDKLFQFKNERENELLTYLGINNVQSEKKEHLIVDEVNANNQMIEESGNCCLNSLEEMCQRVTDVLGYPLSVRLRKAPLSQTTEDDETETEGDEN